MSKIVLLSCLKRKKKDKKVLDISLSVLGLTYLQSKLSFFVCLFFFSYRPRQLLGYIADGPQGRASDNFTCCHT